jgi:hypothetical protein
VVRFVHDLHVFSLPGVSLASCSPFFLISLDHVKHLVMRIGFSGFSDFLSVTSVPELDERC